MPDGLTRVLGFQVFWGVYGLVRVLGVQTVGGLGL